MKRPGIVGCLGPESTVDYYELFIQKYQERMNSTQTLPELFINSINMYNIFKFISEDRLDDLVDYVAGAANKRSEEHTSELQSRFDIVCRLLLEKKKE